MRFGVAWGITGAGHYLLESHDAVEELLKKGVLVDMFYSKAGEEVSCMYGIFDKRGFHQRIENKDYAKNLRRIIRGSAEGQCFPSTGHLSLGYYNFAVISPATANTVSKLLFGIADTLVTSMASQAIKGNTRVIVVPTDLKPGPLKTRLPIMVKADKCPEFCGSIDFCVVVPRCPYGAFSYEGGRGKVERMFCQGCQSCVEACPYGVVSFGEEHVINVSPRDTENTEKLAKVDYFKVIETPEEAVDFIIENMGKTIPKRENEVLKVKSD